MKLIFILGTFLCLSACHPTINDKTQEQNFICKSLIKGYLQAQQLGQYEFHQKTNEYGTEQYIYRQPTVSGMVLGIPKAQQIKFECVESVNETYDVYVIDQFTHKEAVLRFHALEKI